MCVCRCSSFNLTNRDEMQRHMSYKYSYIGYSASVLMILLGCITASSDVLAYHSAAVICLRQSRTTPCKLDHDPRAVRGIVTGLVVCYCPPPFFEPAGYVDHETHQHACKLDTVSATRSVSHRLQGGSLFVALVLCLRSLPSSWSG